MLLIDFVDNMKMEQSIWEKDKNRAQFLKKSRNELKASSGRFKKEKRETLQIRIEKDVYRQVKMISRLEKKTMSYIASNILATICHDLIDGQIELYKDLLPS